jgi:hypothetical protein
MNLYPPPHPCLSSAGAVRPNLHPVSLRFNSSAVVAWVLRAALVLILAMAAFA